MMICDRSQDRVHARSCVLDLTRVCARAHTGLDVIFLCFKLLNRRYFTYLISISVLKVLFHTLLGLRLYIHVYSLQTIQFMLIISFLLIRISELSFLPFSFDL
jgi:hypothetical protein